MCLLYKVTHYYLNISPINLLFEYALLRPNPQPFSRLPVFHYKELYRNIKMLLTNTIYVILFLKAKTCMYLNVDCLLQVNV